MALRALSEPFCEQLPGRVSSSEGSHLWLQLVKAGEGDNERKHQPPTALCPHVGLGRFRFRWRGVVSWRPYCGTVDCTTWRQHGGGGGVEGGRGGAPHTSTVRALEGGGVTGRGAGPWALRGAHRCHSRAHKGTLHFWTWVSNVLLHGYSLSKVVHNPVFLSH